MGKILKQICPANYYKMLIGFNQMTLFFTQKIKALQKDLFKISFLRD